MKQTIFFFLLITAIQAKGQIPKSGTYTYSLSYQMLDGQSRGANCNVIIKGDSIKVYYKQTGNLSAKKGELIDEGIIMKNIKTGKYIIAHKPSDADAQVSDGCKGPRVIDFIKKLVWMC